MPPIQLSGINLFLNSRNIICRIIVFIIVIGIILIFFAFLIGWIYSCYLIAKQIQETPDDNETGNF